MEYSFPHTLSALRKSRGLSQRQAAADLGISQALLSHYENGAREPGLLFVVKVCDYYGVSADYLLGRTDFSDGYAERLEEMQAFAEQLRLLAQRAEAFTKTVL